MPRLRRGLTTAITTAITGALAAAALTLTGSAAPAGAAPVATATAAGPLAPVASVDLQRYLGRWEQVAAIPQVFQLQCARNSRAVYTAVDTDTIGVTNTCSTWLGGTSTVTGKADVLDPVTNAQLRVGFDGIPAFGDTTKPNYVITYLAPDYSWAVVGDPDRNSGFVLSRTPKLPVTKKQLKRVIESRGYNSCLFLNTPVDGGRQDRLPLCIA